MLIDMGLLLVEELGQSAVVKILIFFNEDIQAYCDFQNKWLGPQFFALIWTFDTPMYHCELG